MAERCGDRQRKFDGLEKWPFRFFIETLPVMLQIALLLLACGLSRYVWSINTSVACVVISFTALGLLFYIVIVAAGTSSYECPFQTPASEVLRYLRDSGATQRLLARMSLSHTISLIHATWMSTRQGLISAPHYIHGATQYLPSWDISPSRIMSGVRSTATRVGLQTIILLRWVGRKCRPVQRIRSSRPPRPLPTTIGEADQQPSASQKGAWNISSSRIISGVRITATNVGHRTIILLLQIDRTFRDAKQELVQMIQSFRPTVLLPTTTGEADQQTGPLRNGPGLLVRVRNLEVLRKQNADNAGCVCWVLRNITDPEAIDSAIRLAGTIRWFNGDFDHDPPFDLIVSTFEACFSSTKQLYPSMRDKAYFSARAILQINTRARTQSHKCTSKYPIPEVSSDMSEPTDHDLYHVIFMLECNFNSDGPILVFPEVSANTHDHLLWMSNLFVDLTHTGLNPILVSYENYLSMAVANHRAMIADILLMWYISLGGHVEEETFWVTDKSYVVDLIFLSAT